MSFLGCRGFFIQLINEKPKLVSGFSSSDCYNTFDIYCSRRRLISEILPIAPDGERYARRVNIDENRFAVFAESRSGKIASFSAGRDIFGKIDDFSVER